MSLQSRISSFIEVVSGNMMLITRSTSQSNGSLTQISSNPGDITLAGLVSDQKINLCEIINVKQIFLEVSDKAQESFFINVKLGSNTNTNIPVRDFIALTTNFVNDPDPLATTGMFVSNPNNTEVKLKVTVVGTE